MGQAEEDIDDENEPSASEDDDEEAREVFFGLDCN